MIFANYSRKSVFRDNSDSIKNQERMSKEYAQAHFPGQVDDFIIYADEDYSGANARRPDLQRLIEDIKQDKIDVLIVYQLDRLSRDIRDFSNIYSIMSDHNVQFVSVRENIDTTTPIGKAMMYIAVVFAQMERETIANRVADNMISLARDGWWVGGNPPMGYQRKRILTEDGKNHVTIEIVPDQARKCIEMFETFLNGHFTLSSFQTYCRKNNIVSQNNCKLTTTQLYAILSSPYCVPATEEIYDYYAAKGCQMADDRSRWTGEYGVMIYGRTSQRNKTHAMASPEKWTVCVGRHKPFLSTDLWLKTQEQFGKNKIDRTVKYDVPLLKGILRCKCGRMCGMSRKKRVNGDVVTWYKCPRKSLYPNECDMSEIKAELLDNAVIKIFKEIDMDEDAIYRYIDTPSKPDVDPDTIRNKIADTDRKIDRLAESLAMSEGGAAAKYIIAQIEKLDEKKKDLEGMLLKAQSEERQYIKSGKDAEKVRLQVRNLLKDFDRYTDIERNNIAKDIISSCVWDGETLRITL